jgi:hypothetical protein
MTTPDSEYPPSGVASDLLQPIGETPDAQLAQTLPRIPVPASYPHDAITESVPVVAQSFPAARNVPPWAPSAPEAADFRQTGRLALVGLFAAIGLGILIASLMVFVLFSSLTGWPGWLSSARAGSPLLVTPRPLPTATETPSPTPSPTAMSALTTTAATFVTTDTTTQGTWQGTYGAAGYVVIGDSQQLPAGVQVTPSGEADFTWAPSTADPRAPQKASTAGDRIAACWYSPASFTIDVAISDGQTYQLALYVLDWDSRDRSETVTLSDPSSGAVLDTRAVTSFAQGQYLVWNISGHVSIQVANDAADVNAVVSGLFFANG